MYRVTSDITSVSSSSDYQIPPATAKEFGSDRRYAIVGSVLMKEQGWKLRQPVTLRDPENPKLTLTVIPIVELPTEYLARVFYFNRVLFDDAIKMRSIYGSATATPTLFTAGLSRFDEVELNGPPDQVKMKCLAVTITPDARTPTSLPYESMDLAGSKSGCSMKARLSLYRRLPGSAPGSQPVPLLLV